MIGIDKVAITLEHSITNVLHADSLSYNLLSVFQLCEMSYNYLFSNKGVEVLRREDSSIVFTGHLKRKLYFVYFNKSKANRETCLVAKSSMGWLWHRATSPCWDEEFGQTSKGQTHSWANKCSL